MLLKLERVHHDSCKDSPSIAASFGQKISIVFMLQSCIVDINSSVWLIVTV